MGTRQALIAALSVVVATVSPAHAADRTPSSIDRKALATIEDSLVNRFIAIRQAAGLKQLARIKNRSDLRQRVCTAAVRGNAPSNWATSSGIREAYYETDEPATLDPAFEHMAKSDADREVPRRFAVAVWPSQARGKYWVGVGTYWGTWSEWVDVHLTDDMFYRKEWNKKIVPECRHVK